MNPSNVDIIVIAGEGHKWRGNLGSKEPIAIGDARALG